MERDVVMLAAVRNVEERREQKKKAKIVSKLKDRNWEITRDLEVDLESIVCIYYLICFKNKYHKLHLRSWSCVVHLAALLFSIICLMDLRLFLRNLGSTPLREAYLCLLGFWIPFLCAFLPWLWLVWFLLFAMIFNNAKYLIINIYLNLNLYTKLFLKFISI